jgi:flavin reductase (DIM6/NTAB) family NADH-FMN oxidoreductase RutF
MADRFSSENDERNLRDALGCFGTGVTVVTTLNAAGAPVGLTANSFTSVSLEPKLLLVCLAKTSSSLSAFVSAEHFSINVLHVGQESISDRFARPGADRFAQTTWESGSTGVPLISDSLVNFECEKHAMYDGGDHEILIGRVRDMQYAPERGDPLLYFRGKYHRLHFS